MPAGFQGLAGTPPELQVIDPVLSNLARQYTPHGFIYDKIVAPQPVERNIGQYPVFDLAKFFEARGDSAVADDAATPIVDFKWSTEFYHCQDYRLRTRITRKELLQVHPALRLEVSKVKGLLSIMALEREKRLAKALRAEEEGGQLTVNEGKPFKLTGEKWDKSKAQIQIDLQKAGQVVYEATGRRPNTLVLTEQIALAVASNPTIVEIVKYLAGTELVLTGNAVGNSQLMTVAGGSAVLPKKLFGFDIVCADGALENKAPVGATVELNEVWGKTPRLLYVNTNAEWGIPTVAYSFRGRVQGEVEGEVEPAPGNVTQLEPEGSGSWAIVDRWQEPDPPAQNIRAWECCDEKIVAPAGGIELEAVIA